MMGKSFHVLILSNNQRKNLNAEQLKSMWGKQQCVTLLHPVPKCIQVWDSLWWTHRQSHHKMKGFSLQRYQLRKDWAGFQYGINRKKNNTSLIYLVFIQKHLQNRINHKIELNLIINCFCLWLWGINIKVLWTTRKTTNTFVKKRYFTVLAL